VATDHPGIVAALVAFQAALPNVGKTSTAQYGNYADLADVSGIILPRLAQVGICYTAPLRHTDDRYELHAQLRHTSGESIECQWPIALAGPQQMGSAITYGRRYCLLAMCGVHPQGEDDDAAEAQKEHAKLAKDTVKTPRKATRSKTTRGDDQWADLPPITHTPPTGGDDKPNAAMVRRMFALFAELGITDETGQNLYIVDTMGHDFESKRDLTRVEIAKVLDALYERLNPAARESP
jgi:ERF superfamily